MSTYTYEPPDEAAIEEDVTAEVNAEIAAETAPLNTLVSQTERNRDRALEEIGEAFGFVVDASRGSAGRLAANAEQARVFERSIFNAASQELSELRGEAAAEAQRMAQLTGGPVDVASFLEPSLIESGLASSDFATHQLMASGFGQANVALAESYAGATFPLMRAREKKAALNEFNDKIEAIQKEIATIKQSKGTRVSKAARERLLQEREYALTQARSERDWWAQQQGVKIEKDRVKLEKERLKEDQSQFDDTFGLEEEKLGLQKAEAASANRKEAAKLVQAVTTPGQQTYTQTRKVEAGPGTAGAFRDPDSPTGWSQYKDVKVVDTSQVMTRPTEIYDYLISQDIPPAIALTAVRNWLKQKGITNAKSWVPGAAKSPSKSDKRKDKDREGTRPDSTEGGGDLEAPPNVTKNTDPAKGPTKPKPKGYPQATWRKGDKGWGWYVPQAAPRAGKAGWKRVG